MRPVIPNFDEPGVARRRVRRTLLWTVWLTVLAELLWLWGSFSDAFLRSLAGSR